jgi:hypothetical protein
MSHEAIGWVLRNAPSVPAQCVSVLVGLAEHADKHGCGAYPSAGTLSGYARKSERQVRYDLSLLVDAKLIRPGDQSLTRDLPMNRRPVVYDLAMERIQAPEVQPTAPQSGVQPASGVQPTAPQQSTAPHDAADLQEDAGVQSASPQDGPDLGCNTAQPGVQPTADKPPTKPKVKNTSPRRDLNEGREDVERLCVHLAGRIEGNTGERPDIGKRWRDAARLMLDNDHRTEERIHKAIDWSQDSEFWHPHILSMPKLREKYQTLRLQALREQKAASNGHADMRGGARQELLSADEAAALDPGSVV